MSGSSTAGAQLDAAEVIWHDIECGAYGADLDAWRELADAAARPPGSAPLLDIGAGTGRVAIDLARRGHDVTAVDVSPRLLAALAERASGLRVRTVCADARTLELPDGDFALCIVPMQTLQLFGGVSGRRAFLERARALLRPGALLCCALVIAADPFDRADGDEPPAAETAQVGGRLHLSRASRVQILPRRVVIEREREIRDGGPAAPVAAAGRDVVELDRITIAGLRREGRAAGLRSAGTIEVPATPDHVGSTIVMLRG